MTKPLWSHGFVLSVSTMKKAQNSQLPGNLSPDYKYLHASQVPNKLSF